MTRATDIVAYTYAANTYCPDCIIGALPTGEGQAFDGWALAPGVRMSTEANLSELAYAFGFNRADEGTYDSGDFPKVVLSSQVEEPEQCGACGVLIDQPDDSGTGELATDPATNDAVWDAFNDGFGESVGSIGDGDPFWAGIVTLDDRDHYGATTNEAGQRQVYVFATEERATAWLDEMRARLS